MFDPEEDMPTTQETSAVMPGEDAMSAGVEMDAMPDGDTEGTVVDLLPGEEMSSFENGAMVEFSSSEMSAADFFEGSGMPIIEMDAANTMPGEDGMGMAMADLMPGEEPTAQQPGKASAEISGIFHLTLVPA